MSRLKDLLEQTKAQIISYWSGHICPLLSRTVGTENPSVDKHRALSLQPN